MNLQSDLHVIPKGLSTESDHSVGVADRWYKIERDQHCKTLSISLYVSTIF
jgi:hypothetical protein